MSFGFGRRNWKKAGRPFNFRAWAKERRKSADESRRLRGLKAQLELKLDGIQKEILCNDCRGMGCAKCGNQGVVSQQNAQEAPPETRECPRCYGVGHIANKALMSSLCSTCLGTGRVGM